MIDSKVLKFDPDRRILRERADKDYDDGNYLSALRFTYKEIDLFGEDGETYTRLSDIYENMELYASAVNCWFKFMDNCSYEDLPDIYEGLAVNYLNMGNEAQSAFYYNKLIDTDDTLTLENKIEIADAFAKDKRENFRFVYPPKLTDYSRETEAGARALKLGDPKKAISVLSKVEKGSPDYASARSIQAIAYLLSEKTDEAEKICLELVEEDPTNIQALATLAAVYGEQGRKEEARKLALGLSRLETFSFEEMYKIATVCCENDLHEEAFEKFFELEKNMPYDGNLLYFEAIAAYKSGRAEFAVKTLEKLCTIYPDAEVAKFYLKSIRKYLSEGGDPPAATYFYRVPQEERALRCHTLAKIGKLPKTDAQILAIFAYQNGYFRWCFDEMDGMDHDLQYLAVVIAEHAEIDTFLRDVLLDCEVSDFLKIELLRRLYARGEENAFGVVICNIYRYIHIKKIRLGRKKRRLFLDAYAKTASKFVIIKDEYAARLRDETEKLYRKLEQNEMLDLAENPDDLACAIYLSSGLKEVGKTAKSAAPSFDADAEKVERILAVKKEKNIQGDKL